MFKQFLEWIGVKEKIHTESTGPLYYNEGEIWWCALGENIGVEINGKGKMFSRPVFIYRKLSKGGFMGIPLSTKQKEGSWYVSITFKQEIITANLAQSRVLSTSRLYEKMGSLDDSDIKK